MASFVKNNGHIATIAMSIEQSTSIHSSKKHNDNVLKTPKYLMCDIFRNKYNKK